MTVLKRECLHFVLKKYTWRSLAIQSLYHSKLIFLQRNEIYDSTWIHILSVCMWEWNTLENMNPHSFCADNGVDLASISPVFFKPSCLLTYRFLNYRYFCFNVLFKKCCITSTFSNSKVTSECDTLFTWAFKNFWQYFVISNNFRNFISDANNNK